VGPQKKERKRKTPLYPQKEKNPCKSKTKLSLIEPLPLPDDDAGGVPAINGVAEPLSYLRGESG
jgi:hypothetical protein